MILDLDGVLLDVSERYYRVHCAIAGAKRMSKACYWDLKRARAPIEELVEPGADASFYKARWLDLIERQDYLACDCVIPRCADALKELSADRVLTLATLRRDEAAMRAQLTSLDLERFFSSVLCAAPSAEPWRSKRELLASAGAEKGAGWIVGDTEVDARCGKALGLKTAAVLSGIRDRERLELERPDALLEGLWEFPSLLAKAAR